jgi:membrane-associated HD superfamily phosphohydrolase
MFKISRWWLERIGQIIRLEMSTDRTKLVSSSMASYSGSPQKYQRLEATGMSHEHTLRAASNWLFVVQALLVILFATLARETFLENNKFLDTYQLFTGVEIMMFIGFGYLMTFLKKYGMGALGFTMLITVVGLQWGILTEVRSIICMTSLITDDKACCFCYRERRRCLQRSGSAASQKSSPSTSPPWSLAWTLSPHC